MTSPPSATARSPNLRPLPPPFAYDFLFQICKGVTHYNSRDVLHRGLGLEGMGDGCFSRGVGDA
ncbi:hypothetical protein Fmac_021310 [Flemingia macrophylla]|uniref:Uncharacterized protein n=1 Tax=Flemingia macrophylla TaxID=520843 RepID=A0ABD1LWH5_9FABA